MSCRLVVRVFFFPRKWALSLFSPPIFPTYFPYLYPMAVSSFLGGSDETPFTGFRKGTPPFPFLHGF
jgi:hypothetical protein